MNFKVLLPSEFGEIDSRTVNSETEKALSARADAALPVIKSWPDYEPTPLMDLPGLAKTTNVATLKIKDEAGRFGLGSFKALGGAYAIAQLLIGNVETKTGKSVGLDFLLSDEGLALNNDLTVCCATDGNHGRSVAWGAQMFGCGCTIFIHATVSEERAEAIAHYGAKVVRTAGNYDDSVREAQAEAETNGWTVVSDTSYEGYRDIPIDVMAGYSIMAREAIEQWDQSTAPPTHVFLQTGVGAMAASVAVQLRAAYGEATPKIILCDPMEAACWFESLKAGRPSIVSGDLETLMAGLACGEVSQLAWDILSDQVVAVIALEDTAAETAMRQLNAGNATDASMIAGESGVGGLAGFLAIASDVDTRDSLNLTSESRLLFFSTEGATDVDTYERIVGKSLG